MQPEKRKARGLFRAVVDWFLALVGETVPVEHQMEASINTMIEALDAKADAASYAMAIAEQTRQKLAGALAEHDEYATQAANFARAGDEESARGCLSLQMEAEANVKRLTALLQSQQAAADKQAADFAQSEAAVKARKAELPDLKAQARITAASERFAQAQGRYNVDAALGDFDDLKGEVETRRLAAEARSLLTRDPKAELRQKIREHTQGDALNARFAELQARVAGQGEADASAPAAPKAIEHHPVDDARSLLAAPRYQQFARTKTS